ncbi:MAG: hypothetical protein ACC683_11455 [Acidimicrobiia bacterium]
MIPELDLGRVRRWAVTLPADISLCQDSRIGEAVDGCSRCDVGAVDESGG